jgi:streptogramin lyase
MFTTARVRKRAKRYRPDFDRLEDRCLMSVGITEFNTPSSYCFPTNITTGPDGNLWFTEQQFSTNKIGRITPAGIATDFQLPAAPSGVSTGPIGITAGPDGNLWFTSTRVNTGLLDGHLVNATVVGRITTAGVVTEFAAPGMQAAEITAGPDGNLWYLADGDTGVIGRVTLAGVITAFDVPTGRPGLTGITSGPDGNIWFTESRVGKIGRITPNGAITEFALPPSAAFPADIVAGPDGNLWFADQGSIGRITTAGQPTLFGLPAGHTGAAGITVGADGNLWFSEYAPNLLQFENVYVGRITTSGTITEYLVPASNDHIGGITSGPDGSIWFAESSASKIGHLIPNAPDLAPAAALHVGADNSFQGAVATFTDSKEIAPATAYNATIYWGDGSSSPGTVSGAGQFVVSGTHAFGGGFAQLTTPLEVILHGPNAVATAAAASVAVVNPQVPFIENLYVDLLHRQAEPAGLSFWMEQLGKGASRAQVTLGFEESAEYATNIVDSLYASLLQRAPDQAGLNSFVTLLEQGATVEQIEQIFLGSAEYYQRAGSNPTGLLSAFYRDMLGRGMDPAGAADFGRMLANGVSAGSIAGIVLSSSEFEKNRVESFYSLLLHRAADAVGLAGFMTALKLGVSDAQVLATMAGSAEYFAKPLESV